jgi:molybdopterin-guanine dinucleotide biosynthesis protein A
MGRDKSRIKLAGTTMLSRVRSVAHDFLADRAFAARVRIIRKDVVRRCGPLGGIITGLRRSQARAVLLLACDMPLVSPGLLKRMMRASRRGECAVFACQGGRVGLPCLLPRHLLAAVEGQMMSGEFSLQALARKLKARRLHVSARRQDLFNVNTPADAREAGRQLRRAG